MQNEAKIYAGGFFKGKRYEGTMFNRLLNTEIATLESPKDEFAKYRGKNSGYVDVCNGGSTYIGDFAETGYFAPVDGMGPGNSGSVMINENKEVIGIYVGRTGEFSNIPRYQKMRSPDFDFYYDFCRTVGI
jgi:hypothetical protein